DNPCCVSVYSTTQRGAIGRHQRQPLSQGKILRRRYPAPVTSPKRDTSMDSESRDHLTVAQAAEYLQVSQSSIRSYIRQGHLQAYRIAGKRKVLIARSALLSLLEPARPENHGDSGATGDSGNGGQTDG
ncbi:MAG TPA: helix-turn-helix domain-containing protein, partial [Chthonomonadales bacterium]|nr:helix-turn-helix domain-containing protein [Chthonomonadales bacterium]